MVSPSTADIDCQINSIAVVGGQRSDFPISAREISEAILKFG